MTHNDVPAMLSVGKEVYGIVKSGIRIALGVADAKLGATTGTFARESAKGRDVGSIT